VSPATDAPVSSRHVRAPETQGKRKSLPAVRGSAQLPFRVNPGATEEGRADDENCLSCHSP